MKVIGMDFTSCPGPTKQITYLSCNLENGCDLRNLPNFNAFETVLSAPGSWIAGIDFPFGQSERFIETVGWPLEWASYVNFVSGLDRERFCKILNDYRKPRSKGDKEHRRVTDCAAESISPQKLYGVPVGKMFFEGAPRLLKAGVMIPGLQKGDPTRIVVEAYPAVLARKFIRKKPYKNDNKIKQTNDQREARRELLRQITDAPLLEYGISVVADAAFVDDPTGDQLDALLCAIQAAWSWLQRENCFGAPSNSDHVLEGWIADPKCRIGQSSVRRPGSDPQQRAKTR
jgi:hypothetical protein